MDKAPGIPSRAWLFVGVLLGTWFACSFLAPKLTNGGSEGAGIALMAAATLLDIPLLLATMPWRRKLPKQDRRALIAATAAGGALAVVFYLFALEGYGMAGDEWLAHTFWVPVVGVVRAIVALCVGGAWLFSKLSNRDA